MSPLKYPILITIYLIPYTLNYIYEYDEKRNIDFVNIMY
jgi:hypothetical protein